MSLATFMLFCKIFEQYESVYVSLVTLSKKFEHPIQTPKLKSTDDLQYLSLNIQLI